MAADNPETAAALAPPDSIEAGWTSRWWHKHKWRKQITLPGEEVDGLLDVLADRFNGSWQACHPEFFRHPVYINLMLGEGTPQIRNLLFKAQQYQQLEHVHGFKRVRDGYEDPLSWASADLEMLMGSVFCDGHFTPEFIVPRSRIGKTPDLLIDSPVGPFTIECKRLQEASAEQWIGRYGEAWWRCLKEAAGSHGLLLRRDDIQLNIRRHGFPDELASAELAAAVDAFPLVTLIKETIAEGRLNRLLRFRGWTLVVMSGQLSGLETVFMPELDEKFFISRLMRNGFSAGAQQIDAYYEKHGVPGLLAIWQAHPCGYPRLSREVTKALTLPENKGVIGVLVQKMGNILTYQQPLWVRSPRYQESELLDSIEARIIEAFQPVIIA